jgi:tRNA-dihydrouridine synthase
VEKITAWDFLQAVKDLPLAAIMVHGRSYEQPFSGQPDYETIKIIKENFAGIVLGNGGIFTPEAAKEMLEKTGADGLGLARGLYGRPWLFEQIKEYLKKGSYSEFTFAQIKKAMLLHAKLAYRSSGGHGLVELRKHLAWYVKGLPGAVELRQQLVVVKSLAEIKDILRKY